MLTQTTELLRRAQCTARVVGVDHPIGIADQIVIAPGGGRSTALVPAKLLAPTMLTRQLPSFDPIVETEAVGCLWPPRSATYAHTVLQVRSTYDIQVLLLDHPADRHSEFVAAMAALLAELERSDP